MDNPDSIAALNSMNRHEVELFVSRQEGRLSAGYGYQNLEQQLPKAQLRTVSRRPVSTVTGKSSPKGASLEEASYSECRKIREAQMKARR